MYTTMRLLLLIAAGGICALIGLRGIGLIIVAFLISGVISLFLLRDQREEYTSHVSKYFNKLNNRIDLASSKEDELDDQARQAAAEQIDLTETQEAPTSAPAPTTGKANSDT